MTLKELQQQIVSKAVKAFREKKNLAIKNGGLLMEIADLPELDPAAVESFLTSTLHQATQRVAEETITNVFYPGGRLHGLKTIQRAADSWLNHNSEQPTQ